MTFFSKGGSNFISDKTHLDQFVTIWSQVSDNASNASSSLRGFVVRVGWRVIQFRDLNSAETTFEDKPKFLKLFYGPCTAKFHSTWKFFLNGAHQHMSIWYLISFWIFMEAFFTIIVRFFIILIFILFVVSLGRLTELGLNLVLESENHYTENWFFKTL